MTVNELYSVLDATILKVKVYDFGSTVGQTFYRHEVDDGLKEKQIDGMGIDEDGLFIYLKED
jgi:hypothetical protein